MKKNSKKTPWNAGKELLAIQSVANRFVSQVPGDVHLVTDRSLAMKQDPLIAATKKAYQQSAQYRLDQLLEKRARWRAKLNKAVDRVESIDRELRKYLTELVAEKDGRKPQ